MFASMGFSPVLLQKFGRRARFTGKVSRGEAEMLAHIPELAKEWRNAFAQIASGQNAENTDARLIG